MCSLICRKIYRQNVSYEQVEENPAQSAACTHIKNNPRSPDHYLYAYVFMNTLLWFWQKRNVSYQDMLSLEPHKDEDFADV